jgi:hypothetical protein
MPSSERLVVLIRISPNAGSVVDSSFAGKKIYYVPALCKACAKYWECRGEQDRISLGSTRAKFQTSCPVNDTGSVGEG